MGLARPRSEGHGWPTPVRVGTDLDGCVYELLGRFRQWIHQEMGRPLASLPEPSRYDFWTQWGLSAEEFASAYEAAVCAGFLLAEGEAVPGARETINRLFDAGHEIHIHTARFLPDTTFAWEVTVGWLEKSGIPFTSLVLTDEKGGGTDIFLEDSPANYAAIEAAGGHPVLFSRSYNLGFPARRVQRWEEFGALVDELAST